MASARASLDSLNWASSSAGVCADIDSTIAFGVATGSNEVRTRVGSPASPELIE